MPGDFSQAWQALEDQLVNGGMSRIEARDYISATYDIRPRTRGEMAGHYPDVNPDSHTWHHHQDRSSMFLVEFEIHDVFTHTGGASLARSGD